MKVNLLARLRDLIFGPNGYDAKELDKHVHKKRETTMIKWREAHDCLENTKQAFKIRTPEPEEAEG